MSPFIFVITMNGITNIIAMFTFIYLQVKFGNSTFLNLLFNKKKCCLYYLIFRIVERLCNMTFWFLVCYSSHFKPQGKRTGSSCTLSSTDDRNRSRGTSHILGVYLRTVIKVYFTCATCIICIIMGNKFPHEIMFL